MEILVPTLVVAGPKAFETGITIFKVAKVIRNVGRIMCAAQMIQDGIEKAKQRMTN